MKPLVEFSEGFAESDWCTRGHAGYVLKGRMSVDFSGEIIDFKAGDGIFIPEGEENRHKARVARGERALLLLFEEV
jgi:quercetin dioxygenase-like cupin family protein